MTEPKLAEEGTAICANTPKRYDEESEESDGPHLGSLKQSHHEDSETKKSFLGGATTRRKILFGIIIYGHTTVFMCVSTPFSFIATYIMKKGGTKEEATISISLLMLAMAISSAFFGKYQDRIGTKKLFLRGIVCFGMGQVLFGFLAYAQNSLAIAVIGGIIRIIQGCSQGAYLVSALTAICQEFSEHAGTAFGIAEAFVSVGFTCGPFLGSILFNVSNDILLPFLVTGILLIPLIPAGIYLLKDYETTTSDSDNVHAKDFITRPTSVFLLGVVTSVYGSFGVVDILAPIYLTTRGFSIIEVGVALVVQAGTFSVFSPFAAKLSAIGNRSRRVTFVVGLLSLCGVCFLFTRDQSMVWLYVAFALFGIICAVVLMTSFIELLHLAVGDRAELKQSFAVHSTLSGVWNFAFGIGGFVYPFIGAALMRAVQFEFTFLLTNVIGICISVALTIILGICQHAKK